MARDLVTGFKNEKNKLESSNIIRLFKIYTSPALYLAEYDQNVTFNSQIYTAMPMSSSSVSENSKGEVDSMSITIGNANRDMIAIVQGQEMIDLRVDIMEVFANNLSDPNAFVGDTFYISNISVTQEAAIFTLVNILNRADVMIPKRTYSKGVCQWRFKSIQCGFATGYADVNFTANSSQYSPNVPADDYVSWGAVTIYDPVLLQNVNVVSGNAQFIGDPIYIVYEQGNTTLLSKSRLELRHSTEWGVHEPWIALCKYEGKDALKRLWSKTVSGGGSLTTCDLTLSSSNGCESHNNRVRWGAFPGVGIGGRYYL